MSHTTDAWRLVNIKESTWHQHSVVCKRSFQTRFMQKDGSCNVYFKSILGEWESYVVDIFTTLVDMKWRHMLIIFTLSYILSWLLFGFIFWLIALQHGDLNDMDIVPCVDNVHTFVGAFLFSLETQTTIGYGYRGVTVECSFAIIMVTIQSVLSCVIDTFIIGAAMAKMATARKRAQTVRFSYFALVGIRDGKLCLMWRVGDFRPNHVVEGNVRAQLLRYHEDHEKGITMGYKDLKLVNDQIILVTPVTVVHVIDQDSPLYALDRKALAADRFEILVTFIYTGDSTGTSHQSRTSYLPREILWGFRFNNILEAKKKYYKVDCEQFEEMTEYYAPFCSAKQLDINAMPASPTTSSVSIRFTFETPPKPVQNVLSSKNKSSSSMTNIIHISESTDSMLNDLSKVASTSSMPNGLFNMSQNMASVASLGTIDDSKENLTGYNIIQDIEDKSYQRVFKTLSNM
ncbi:inward rectifier potassium channel 16 [Rana temporaria]|uniref:inward rectifier potassium channel 16 n=1 Tax=Rana temporaria TaxID=8407 RepID=UPI001AAD3BD7|nr:inward rectifier potassium channel 16 [Rana temporaria]XP_040186964.1 inward rectifier potassium channel 16 [Rana temporaria]XP_040186965.1 inward rectifier potassium channel 16 [Rana temporaria]